MSLQKNMLEITPLNMDKLQLDEISLGILNLLSQDGKLTNKELAQKLNLSISPIFERRKKLEEAGYIIKYVAIIDREKVKCGLTYLTKVSMLSHTNESYLNFLAHIKDLKEVVDCYHLAGSDDFMLKVVTPDMSSYHRLLRQRLSRIKDVGKIITDSVVSQPKSELGHSIDV